MFQDLRFGVRMLLKNPGLTVVIVLLLALGIGVNTGVFTALNGLMMRARVDNDPDSFVHFAAMPGKRGNKDMLHKYPLFRRTMFESPIAAAAAALARSKTMRYYEDVLVYVEEGWDDRGGWHQDTPTWPLQGSQFVNVW